MAASEKMSAPGPSRSYRLAHAQSGDEHIAPLKVDQRAPKLVHAGSRAARISPDDPVITLYEVHGENISLGSGLARRAHITENAPKVADLARTGRSRHANLRIGRLAGRNQGRQRRHLDQERRPQGISLWLRQSLEKVGDGFAITRVHLSLKAKVPAADQAKFEELAAKAKAGCPVSKLLNAKITLDATLVD